MKLPMPSDAERALTLLERIFHPRNTYGQKLHIPTTISKADIARLESEGLDPHAEVVLTHDEAIDALLKHDVSIAHGAKAFVASLDAPAPHGCFLEAALLIARMPRHELTCKTWCHLCGLHATMSYRPAEMFMHWHTWGSGIPGDIIWAIAGASAMPARPKISPRADALLKHSLAALAGLPASAKAGKAFDAVEAIGVAKARSVVGTLAFSGILEAPPHLGLATKFVSFADRDRRPSVRNENDAPLGFWSGANGVSWKNAKLLFGNDVDGPLPELERVAAPPKPKRKTLPSASKSTTLKRRPAERGDLWAVRMREDAYVLAYVWRLETKGGRQYALTEFVNDIFPTCPSEAPSALVNRPRYDGRWWHWTHSLEKTTGSALIATKVSPPKTNGADPDRAPNGSGKDLAYLAQHCFRD